ncbi:MAG: DUF5830 family protein [Halanaeroarchaeum sp.]
MEDDPVEMGLELLESIEAEEVDLAAAMDRVEAITSDPAIQREILDAAEKRGLLDRESGVLRPRRGAFVRFESQVVEKDGDFECRRCGAGLSTGHFVRFESGELGPFGSECIRKVTGRD